jgi:predicted TIM-barrel fold metal-dependent hydrolase
VPPDPQPMMSAPACALAARIVLPNPPGVMCTAGVGAERILFSTDYPYGDPMEHARFIAQVPISRGDRDKIAHRNAQHLFRV